MLYNAAKEPEIESLCAYLEKCGAVITGAGTECIRVRGKGVLQSAEFFAKPDRIVAGTYMAAVAACGGSVYLQGVTPSLCRGFWMYLPEWAWISVWRRSHAGADVSPSGESS